MSEPEETKKICEALEKTLQITDKDRQRVLDLQELKQAQQKDKETRETFEATQDKQWVELMRKTEAEKTEIANIVKHLNSNQSETTFYRIFHDTSDTNKNVIYRKLTGPDVIYNNINVPYESILEIYKQEGGDYIDRYCLWDLCDVKEQLDKHGFGVCLEIKGPFGYYEHYTIQRLDVQK